MEKEVKRIAVTGGAGQIAYSLLFRIASGELFGKEQPIALQILEVPEALNALEGVKMELEDGAFHLLRSIKIGVNAEEIFEGITEAFLVGAKPRGPGMERRDLLAENGKIFKEQGKALNQVADRNAKILVIGNPCNTNCLIALLNAPRLKKENFHAMTRLDQNRAVYQLAKKANTTVDEVRNLAIWGNHSSTMVPDFIHAKIGEKAVIEVIQDASWLETTFIETVQKRGASIIAARGKSSAASAANAALEAMKAICFPTPKDKWYSSAIYSENNPYGINPELIFSFPCYTGADGKVEIVKGLELNDFLRRKVKHTEQELIEEKELMVHIRD